MEVIVPLRHLVPFTTLLSIYRTAVASMRRTEALASLKFYQILSIFIFLIRLIILEDFIRLISYNGPCVRLGCSFFLATALYRSFCLWYYPSCPMVWLLGVKLLNPIYKIPSSCKNVSFGWCIFLNPERMWCLYSPPKKSPLKICYTSKQFPQ